MKNSNIAATLGLLCAAGLGGAYHPAQAQEPGRAPATRTSPAQEPVTVAGCLYREDQVPGRKPNIAERQGILEDYIIAGAAYAKTQGTGDAKVTAGAKPKTGNMYKVEGPADEQLKALVGKKVEVVGRIDPEGMPGTGPGAATPDRGPGPDRINLPEFEASSIREVSGSCPATPAPRT
jgi:hypothetical protein